jgi:NADH-quinone oxidoreductase subunit N
VAGLAVLSMVIGNLLALAQKNIKRLLAYSSISHAGYILIGVAANSELGATGAAYYLLAYLVTNIAAFGIVHAVGRALGSDEISAYSGLSRRNAGLALAMLAALLSLGGIPPFGGFIGKLLVFGAGVQSGMIWLVAIGVLNTVVGLYYYLNVLKVIYMGESTEGEKPIPLARPWALALVLCVVGILVVGVILAPWYDLASQAAGGLLALR